MPKVWNRRDKVPDDAVYVGRGSKWGNPYRISFMTNREEVIQKFEAHLFKSGLINDIEELRGKDLVCWCKPEACHGDILLKYANKE